ncbi:hypothetical protein [Hymenobacter glacieicola]|uniref:Lipoprotein n=1 Tax=Hymenobacter glacieicola TaxID=1562124 RepID=A0ABQ1WKD7_9BACT|nr:hypothetical protein [Hymenobacter glacieicola]GGG34806.1 hypothetical protein GCM10011378_08980 [Hymenobacter glacieicola]
MKTTATLLASALTLLSGCITPVDDLDTCPAVEYAVKSLESEYGCADTRRQLGVNLSETHTIIRSQAEFDQQVSGPCHPQIDFTKYDLVIGKKGLANGNAGIKYSLLRECSGAQLVLRVVFNQGLTTEAPNLTYHALVPKLAAGQELKVDIEINNR